MIRLGVVATARVGRLACPLVTGGSMQRYYSPEVNNVLLALCRAGNHYDAVRLDRCYQRGILSAAEVVECAAYLLVTRN